MSYYHNKTLQEILKITKTNQSGLTDKEAELRLKTAGPNSLNHEKKQNYFLQIEKHAVPIAKKSIRHSKKY